MIAVFGRRQPPREGEIVAYVRRGKIIPALIVRWNGDPDAHAMLVDIELTRSARYVDGLIREDQLNAQGENLLPERMSHEARAKITGFLDTKRGKELITNRRPMAARPPAGGPGSPLPWASPLKLHDEHRETRWHASFENYLDFWIDRYPQALADLEERNSDHAATFRAVFEQGHSVASYARSINRSVHTVYSWHRRALSFMRFRVDRMGDWEASPTDRLEGVV